MLNWSRKHRRGDDGDMIDALAALRMLEDEEQSQDEEFFRIVGEMQQFGCSDQDLTHVLPDLLKTRREHALYEALLTITNATRPGHRAVLPRPVRERSNARA